MNEYKKLEDKLDNSISQIDKLLSEEIELKVICICNKRILLDNNFNLPSVRLAKKDIKEYVILECIYNTLNINCINISSIPFEYYNNYKLRYYKIGIAEEELLNINNNYNFYLLSNVTNKEDLNVLMKVV